MVCGVYNYSVRMCLTLILLQSTCDLNAGDSVERRTALHIAAQLGHPDIIQCLVGFNVDVNAVDSHQKTPLQLLIANRSNSTLTAYGCSEIQEVNELYICTYLCSFFRISI